MAHSIRTTKRTSNYQNNSKNVVAQMASRNFERWNEYISLINQGDRTMKKRFEHYMEYVSEKYNNEPDVYCTLLEKSQKYPTVEYTNRQLWRLSYLCAKINFQPAKPFRSASLDLPIKEDDDFARILSEFEEVTVEEPVWTPDPNGVRLGDTVCFVDIETGEERSFLLSRQSSLENGKLDISSPVAQAMLGHIQDDNVVAKTPCGDRKLQIISISRNN